jgi:hypothetical protein
MVLSPATKAHHGAGEMHALKRSRALPTLVLLLMFGSGCWVTTKSVTIRNETDAEVKVTKDSDTLRHAYSIAPGEQLSLSDGGDFWTHIRAQDGSVLGSWHVGKDKNPSAKEEIRVLNRDGTLVVEEAPRSIVPSGQPTTSPAPEANPD